MTDLFEGEHTGEMFRCPVCRGEITDRTFLFVATKHGLLSVHWGCFLRRRVAEEQVPAHVN